MSVTLISSPAELPADPSPGLFVLVQDEPAGAAAAVAEILGCLPACTPSQAALMLSGGVENPLAEDSGPDDAEVLLGIVADPQEHEEALARAAAREAALEQAGVQAAEARARVPARARGVAIERLESAAASVRAAEEATDDARVLLGERPELPAEAAEAALAAEEAVSRAHQQRAVDIDRSSTLLLGANALGILIVAGRVRTPAVEPIFVLVAAFPLTALFHLVATFGAHTWQARAAAQSRRQALRATGMATMTGLAARSARLKAWTARADALAAAEAVLAQSRRRWTALAGAGSEPAQIAALLRTVAEAERAAAALAQLEGQSPEAEAEVVPGLELEPDPDPGPDAVADPGPAREVAPGLVPEPGPVPGSEPDPEAAPGLQSERPVLVLIDGSAGQPLAEETRVLLEQWDDQGLACPVVVVSACSELGAWAEARTVGVGAEVVDLRERVMASLDRLRARAASFGDPGAPGSMAADG